MRLARRTEWLAMRVVCLVLLLGGWVCSGSPAARLEETGQQEGETDGAEQGGELYDGAQVIKVVASGKELLEELIEKENMDVWAGNATHLDIYIPKQKVDTVKKLLTDKKIDYRVMINNLEEAIRAQNPSAPAEEDEELDGRKGHRMNWQKYHRLETIYGYLDYLGQTYPGLASVGVIGQSHESRPIKYLKVSSGKPNAPAFLIDGGIHAREWISPATVTYIMKELVENRDSLPEELKSMNVYFVPVLNPDGYEYTHTTSRMWRKNRARGFGCAGVDLNRNFNNHWGGKGTSANSCSEIYRGSRAASEPETRAFMNFVSGLGNNLKAYVTFHSYGQYILIPYGYDYNAMPANFAEMKTVGDRAALAMRQTGGQLYTVGHTANTLYPAAGGSDDWVKASTGAPFAYTIELRDTGGYGFTLPAREIMPTSNEAFQAIKERWKETENKLLEKLKEAEQSKVAALTKSSIEIANLKGKLRQAEGSISDLQVQLNALKEEKVSVEKLNEQLSLEVTRLGCEVTEYKKEMEDWKNSEKEKLLALESNAAIQAKLSQANTEITRKQTEIVRLNGLLGQLRGELEKIRLGSVINQTAENLTGTISQLQAALAIERDNCKDILKEKETMAKEILDLRRQVKEMENIVIKRSKSGSQILLSDSVELKELEKKNKALLSELAQLQELLSSKQKFLTDLESKYNEEVSRLKGEVEKGRRGEEREPPPRALKEDAHLLATIRGLKAEISSRDKDIIKLNRELDDVRKTNKRLQREREKALNAGKYRVNVPTKETVDKAPQKTESAVQGSCKEYDAALYEEQETVNFLRTENKTLKEEIRKLEQDLISLHNKRIQDLSDLQEEHEVELSRVQSAKTSSSQLQGQIYTQQMVIHHLKEQIKILEERAGEASLLKAERDHLESSLIEANKKIARLHELQSPESIQYTELLEKLDFLERRHEVREGKLQSVVRELLSKQGQEPPRTCGTDCRDKLLNKNREICYYRAEMDKILDTLAEFRWNM